jgi:molybdopterin-guanine dinucleotide biosynthesis protein A
MQHSMEKSARHPVIPFSAVVLAAGRSTRMGREKALLEVAGVPLWQRQRELLEAAGASEIFLSARPDQAWAFRTRGFTGIIHDALPDGGPLVGLTAALERASRPLLAVLAVDLPKMTAEWFSGLRAEASEGVGVVGRCGGFYEPLAALYPREMMWLAWEELANNRRALQPLVAAAVGRGLLRVREIGPSEEAWFTNWNEPSAGPTGAA